MTLRNNKRKLIYESIQYTWTCVLLQYRILMRCSISSFFFRILIRKKKVIISLIKMLTVNFFYRIYFYRFSYKRSRNTFFLISLFCKFCRKRKKIKLTKNYIVLVIEGELNRLYLLKKLMKTNIIKIQLFRNEPKNLLFLVEQ